MARQLIRNLKSYSVQRTAYSVPRNTQYAAHSTKRGFSLLEVLLAILLLGTGFAVLLQIVSTALSASGVNENEIVAANLIQEKTEELRNASYASVASEAKAAVSGFSAFSRQVAVTTPQTDLKQAVVTVYYTVKSTEISTSVTTYISNV